MIFYCKNITNMTTQEIQKILDKEKQIHQQFIERKNINLSYVDLLLKNFTSQQAQQDIITLSNCKCCLRHQTNKPTIIIDKYVYPYNNKTDHFYQKTDTCHCKCRQLSRFLCKIYN